MLFFMSDSLSKSTFLFKETRSSSTRPTNLNPVKEVEIHKSTTECKEVTTESSTQPCHQKIRFIDRFLKKLGEVVEALD